MKAEKKPKRSNEKRITRKAKILRFMRLSQGLSTLELGKKINLGSKKSITGSCVTHIEFGRFDPSRELTHAMVDACGYTLDEYFEYLDGKEIPLNYRDESIALIRLLSEAQTQAAYMMLKALRPEGTTR